MNIKKMKIDVIGLFKKSGIFFTEEELREKIELVNFYGIENFYDFGISLITCIDTQRVGAREEVLLPGQICPEHVHPRLKNSTDIGKEETFRCRWGKVYLYVDGEKTENIKAEFPKDYKNKFSIFHEIILNPGDQYKLEPGTWHWICGGPEGTVFAEFTSKQHDVKDEFYDKNIKHESLNISKIF